MTLKNSEKLFLVLEKVKKRYCSIFFSKLVLYGEEPEEEVNRVRHYDIECQAAINIVDIIHTKIKTVQFKCFYLLKYYARTARRMSDRKLEISQVKSNGARPTPKFERMNRNFASSSNLRSYPEDFQPRYVQQRPIMSRKENIKSQFSDMDYSMKALMSKVKNLSERFSKKNHQNYSQQPEQEDYQSQKMQKRKLILSKLSKLENDLTTFLQQQNSGRYETTSNISYKRPQPTYTYRNYAQNPNKSNKQHYYTTFISRQEIY